MDPDKKDALVALAGQAREREELQLDLAELESSQSSTAAELADLRRRGEALLAEAGIDHIEAAEADPPADVETGAAPDTELPAWAAIVEQYRQEEPSAVSLDELLPPEVVTEIDRAFEGPVRREPWDRWKDHLMVGAAGIVGALFDLLLSHRLLNRPDIHSSIKHSRHAIDFPVEGGVHRVIGGGHDLFRFAEARQMIIDGTFSAKYRGGFITSSIYRYGGREFPYTRVPEEAATNALLTHWLADFFSTRSLPIPGWSFLTQDSDRLASFAIQSYQAGLNLRSLLSNTSGVLLTGMMLRLYTYIGQFARTGKIDPFLWKNIKYQEMCLVAQSINLLVNLGKVAVTKNLFAINVPAIMAVIRHAIPVLKDARRRRSPLAIVDRNRALLDERWSGIDELAAADARESPVVNRLLGGPELRV